MRGTIVVQVPPCIVNTPAGHQLPMRVLTENWSYYTRNDLDAAWSRPVSLSGLMRLERRLGRRPEPNHACAVCNAPTRTKCSHCLQVYYCSVNCQREHWSLHRDECQIPEATVERHVGIAVPDYCCFWAYQQWLERQTLTEGDPGICIMSLEMFQEQFGYENLRRSCISLALTGRPACLVINCFQ